MTTRALNLPTLSDFPLVIGEVLRRNAVRERRQRRRFWRRIAKRVHTARIGSEIIESNLPLP